MVVDLSIEAKRKINKGDILIANEKGVFELVSQEDFLKNVNREIEELKKQNERLLTILKGISKNTATVLKGVIK